MEIWNMKKMFTWIYGTMKSFFIGMVLASFARLTLGVDLTDPQVKLVNNNSLSILTGNGLEILNDIQSQIMSASLQYKYLNGTVKHGTNFGLLGINGTGGNAYWIEEGTNEGTKLLRTIVKPGTGITRILGTKYEIGTGIVHGKQADNKDDGTAGITKNWRIE